MSIGSEVAVVVNAVTVPPKSEPLQPPTVRQLISFLYYLPPDALIHVTHEKSLNHGIVATLGDGVIGFTGTRQWTSEGIS